MERPLILTTPQPTRHPAPTAKASALAYLMFDRTDLNAASAFLNEFGLIEVSRTEREALFRGTGPAPYCYVVRKAARDHFRGFGLCIDTRDELDRLAALPGASPIEALSWPGGGLVVHLTDPSGFQVDAVFDRTDAAPLPHRTAMSLNSVDAADRVNRTQRVPVQPPEIIRLGHVVLEVAEYQKTAAWYTQHFGFIPTDIQLLPDNTPAVAFMRIDRGDTPVDHHTLVLAQGFKPTYSHSAYEVIDADAVAMGQRILREHGRKHAWGMGRHILGSQIFDYWEDPWGDKHEHYCDGDLFTSEHPVGLHVVSREAMAQWGPTMPASFVRPKLSFSNVIALVRNVMRSPDLSIGKLRALAKLVG